MTQTRKPQPTRSPLADVPLSVRMLHAELEVACGRSTEVAAETWALAAEDRAELRARVKAFRGQQQPAKAVQ
mgnify:FL=1